MRILVVGAGAVGGYAAARMMESGADVTLLVRERRRRQLEENGLVVRSPKGDFQGRPVLISPGEPADPYDLAVIAMKAYGLSAALRDLAPYIGERTVLLPFLNGFRHLEDIAAAFPGRPLLGGVARIESTLDEEGRIVHTSPFHAFTYGRYAQLTDDRYSALKTELDRIPLLREHPDIVNDMWDKYLFISVMSGLTTLFDASAGEIRESPGGMAPFEQGFAEVSETILRAGGTLSDGIVERLMGSVAGLSHESTTSMLRDMRQGLPTETEHIHGYLLQLARLHGVQTPLLKLIYQRLSIYEKKRPDSR